MRWVGGRTTTAHAAQIGMRSVAIGEISGRVASEVHARLGEAIRFADSVLLARAFGRAGTSPGQRVGALAIGLATSRACWADLIAYSHARHLAYVGVLGSRGEGLHLTFFLVKGRTDQ